MASRPVLARPAPALIALAIALTAIYAVASWRMNIPRYFPEPGITVDFVKMLGPTWQETTRLYVGFVLATFALYGAAVLLVWRARGWRPPWWLLFGLPALFALALIPMYPPTAVDMIHYHADARTLWVHDQNPLIVPPAANPYPVGMSWADLPSPYGPVWSLLTGIVVIPTGDHFIAGLYGLKAMAAVSYLASAYLVWRIVRRAHPGFEALAVVLFAWNPFVLLRVVGNGHNDMVMMAFALFAVERAQVRDWWLMFTMLAFSVLVKYSSALLGLPLLLYAWHHSPGSARDRLRALVPPMALAGVVVVIAFVPFWEGLDTLDTARRQTSLMVTSVPELLSTLLARGLDEEAAQEVARNWTLLAFAAMYFPASWMARRGLEHLVVAGFTVLFLYCAVASGWFRPWYMLWPVALIALRPTPWGAALLVAITLGNSFPDLIEQFRYEWGIEDLFQARAAPVVAQLVLPVAVWIAAILHTGGFGLGAEARPATASGAPVERRTRRRPEVGSAARLARAEDEAPVPDEVPRQ